MLVLTCDLSFKVICDFQGQTYANHALSPLLWPVENQYMGYRTIMPEIGDNWRCSY